jgi:3'-phosphoadenosine 5'-phosphosulfate (PAPS) 3'-phosphatase
MIRERARLVERLRAIHAAIRDEVVASCERSAIEVLETPVDEQAGDTIFAIDRVSEAVLVHHFEELAREWPLVLVAEGLGASGRMTLPHGATPELVVLVDPIDGTRGLMVQKRSAWILTGVAPYRDEHQTLTSIELALQTEIPLVKQHLSDAFIAWSDGGALQLRGERFDRLHRTHVAIAPRPSRATTIEHGFGNLARFFPGPRALLATIDDALIERVLGPQPPGRARAFEDQYICSAGQMGELLAGHDRWCADLRPLVWKKLGVRGLCCHPYDLAAELVARAAGVIVCDPSGAPLAAPLFDVEHDVAWCGFANAAIRDQVLPTLQALLVEHGLS